ncbi:dolichyl-phosphate beta-glucosyltransferase [Petrachloros mirabilis]
MSGSEDGCRFDLSVVIPAHNEAARISPYLSQISDYFAQQNRSYEILVIDDGSTDDTAVVVERHAQFNPRVQLIRLPRRSGKGAAIRYGMQAAIGHYQLFADADGATPISELAALEKSLAEGADISIGSRALAARSRGFSVHKRTSRRMLGALFNAALQRSGIKGISDTQCGFKLFRRTVAQDLFSHSSINGFGFDIELLCIALQRGYRIAEVPVNWSDRPGSKFHLLKDGLATLRELAVIRLNNRRGLYRENHGKRSTEGTLQAQTSEQSFETTWRH